MHPGYTIRTDASITIDSVQRYDPLNVLLVLVRQWKQICFVVALALIVGILASSFVIEPSYTSSAVILPPTGVVAAGPMAADLCISILQSESVEERIIEKFSLQAVWHLETLADARIKLRSEVQIETTSFGAVRITVRDHNATRANDIANEFLTELDWIDTLFAQNEAAHRRAAFDTVKLSEQIALERAESRLKELQQKTALLAPDVQSSQILANIHRIHAELSRRNVDREATLGFASPQNPRIVEMNAEIAALQHQLNLLKDNACQHCRGNSQISAGHFAEIALEYEQALRDVTQSEKQYFLLTSQLALARIDQAQSSPAVQAIDRAVVSDRRSGPERLFLLLASCWVGFASSCLYIFVKQAQAHSNVDPTKQAGLPS